MRFIAGVRLGGEGNKIKQMRFHLFYFITYNIQSTLLFKNSLSISENQSHTE